MMPLCDWNGAQTGVALTGAFLPLVGEETVSQAAAVFGRRG